MNPRKKNVLLGVTGSIAAYKACDITNRLRDLKFDVTVIMTKEAEHFISPLTLQNLSGNEVIRGMFDLPKNHDPLHTALAQRADVILVAPATANLIGKIANGICDDLLSCTIMATRAPVLMAPAMNDVMYRHKAVESNVERLKAFGYGFIGPKVGHLACGYRAVGHLADTTEIIGAVKKVLK